MLVLITYCNILVTELFTFSRKKKLKYLFGNISIPADI